MSDLNDVRSDPDPEAQDIQPQSGAPEQEPTAADVAPDPTPEAEPEAPAVEDAEPETVVVEAAAVEDETPLPPVVSASAPPSRRNSLPPPPPGMARPTAPAPAGVGDAGKILGGIATEISQDEVELVLEDGRLAVIHRRNFAPIDTADLTAVVTQGDRLEGAVLAREDPRERVVLSRAWGIEKRAWEKLAAASDEHKAVEGKITSASKNGLVVDVEGVRGFVPASHVALEQVSNLSSYVGQTMELKIIEVDANPQKRKLVLSRRSLLLRDQRKEAQGLLTSLEVGSVHTGKISSVSDYGAFVDLGGVNGLVHVSEMSWTRVQHPSEMVKVGDEVQVKVLEVKVKRKRIRLSMREVAEDPLSGVVVGSIHTGRVSRLVDFGAFVEIDGVEGLVHLSELAEYRVSAPEELVTPGEELLVKVLSVDAKRRRVELSVRQAISDQFG